MADERRFGPDIRLIVVPARDIRFLDEPPFPPTAESLKEAINTLLTNPPGDATRDQFSRLVKNAEPIVMATRLSPHSPEIIPAYRQLAAELTTDRIDPSALPRQLTTLAIAQVLTLQLHLPPKDRFTFRITGLTTQQVQELKYQLKQSEKLQKQIPPSPESQKAFKELEQETINFYKLLRETVTEDQTQPGAIIRQLTIISHLDNLDQSPVYAFCQVALPEDAREWPRTLALWHWRRVNNHPLAADLLLSGRLTEINDTVKGIVLTAPFEKVITEDDLTSEHLIALTKYFLYNRGIQLHFWDRAYLHLIKIDQNQAQQLRNPHLTYIPNFHSFIEWFFAQEETIVSQFLDTIPIDQLDRKKLLSLVKQLLSTHVMAQNHFPDRDWQPSLRHLERLAEKTNLTHLVSPELAIIKGEKAGIIYLDQQTRQPRTRIPRAGESEKDIIKQLLLEHKIPVLLMTRPTNQDSDSEQTLTTLPYWGQVVMLDETESLRVAGQLDRLLPNQRINTPGYENLLPSHRNEPQVILPRIMPIDNPLHDLANMGVVSISQDSGRITLIVDKEKTRVTATFSPNDLPENSTLRRLCNIAQSMLTAHLDPKKLTREEERIRNSAMKTWNGTAKARGVPQLTPDESVDSLPVLTVIGNKAVKLYLKPSPHLP